MTRTTFIIFACCALFSVCFSQLNHYLAPFHVSVFAGGLLVAFSALRLGFREGWWASFLIGLLIDSSTAVSFGFHGLLFATAHVGVFNLRGRFPREENTFGIIVALLVNLALFFVITVSLIHRSPTPAAMIPRLLVDLLASEVLVLACAPWSFALQERALELCGVSLRRAQRGLL
jgi:cell shape-determining protein MreD